MKLSIVLIVMFAAGACSAPPNVGATCTATDGCDEGLTCDTGIPGGYCTAACTTSGSTSECPEESVCDSVAGNAVTCVKICKSDADCRSDLGCNGVSGSNLKACKPKP